MGIGGTVAGRVGTRNAHPARLIVVLAGVLALVGVLAACDATPVMVEGTVRAAGSGSLKGGVTVELYADDAETLVSQTTTNGVGHYQFQQSSVADGTYRLRVGGQWWPNADSWADATPLTLTAASPTTADAELSAAAWLSGIVVNPDASPAAGVAVYAHDTDGDVDASTLTAADGSYTLGLPTAAAHTLYLADLGADTTVAVGGGSPITFTPTDAETIDVGTIDVTTGLPLPASTEPVAVAASNGYTCAVRGTGTVACWGLNGNGQLGNGTTNDSTTPIDVTGITDATAISAGGYHTCALRGSGTVSCWGANLRGQLGNGTTTDSTTPVDVTGITDATAISAGWLHTCALRSSGTVSCWGFSGNGQLGNGTTTDSSLPVDVTGITDATAVTAGQLHTCVLHSTGTVSCWGSNVYGQLGNGSGGRTTALTPVEVTGISDATAISSGAGLGVYHICALHSTGSVSCWGWNLSGQLGDGTRNNANTPVSVSGITDATTVATGTEHTCVVRTAGAASCWGSNGAGRLGDGTDLDSDTPVDVSDLADATTITPGWLHTCALRSSGTVSCWGGNADGQLGDGTTTDSPTPVDVTGL